MFYQSAFFGLLHKKKIRLSAAFFPIGEIDICYLPQVFDMLVLSAPLTILYKFE